MPVRRIRGNPRSVTGAVTGADGNYIDFESLLERDYLILTRFWHPSAKIEEQPVKIPYVTDRGRASNYTPDFLVDFGTGTSDLVEVKPAEVLIEEKEKFRARFAAAADFASDKGWRFVIKSEIDIRLPVLPNAHFLLHYRTLKPKPDLCARLMRAAESGPKSVGDLIAATIREPSERYAAIPQVWHMLATGILDTDLNTPLNQSSFVWAAMR
ncbi:TnsA endonuclease N-terminal domain-containing protein [Ferrovibrio xuzhouensis]|uniref:TnsA endonuclease N-terminal domain-containing protein n=1 Tax=Ferrovibrio xuzhouensis TaxID=1576914 RepID=A0ABV7VFS9_9PROT